MVRGGQAQQQPMHDVTAAESIIPAQAEGNRSTTRQAACKQTVPCANQGIHYSAPAGNSSWPASAWGAGHSVQSMHSACVHTYHTHNVTHM